MKPASHAVLFDLDGVLLDSRAAMRRAILGTATAALGTLVADDALGPETDHLPHFEILSHLGVHDQDIALGPVWETALAVAARETALFPEAVRSVRRLRSSGAAIGVVTMQPRSRLPWLVPRELSSMFDVVVGWGDAEPKPSGAGIALALQHLRVPASRACFIGDSPSDIAAARAAGVASIGAEWGYTGPALTHHTPDILLRDLSQVPRAVGELLG
ncbi:HAD-IA family hydrolase [Streptomyces syringium]|uniref:HAD family hydrolase n=1 Tax=Streptomyces syringium TaxID=76729 RepID=UPI003432F4B2